MKIWILCSGSPQMDWPAVCDAEGFREACAREADCAIRADAAPPLPLGRQATYLAPGRAARETAALLLPEAQAEEEPLLAPPPRRVSGGKLALPLWVWRLLVWLRHFFGADRQETALAEELLNRLEKNEQDCALVCSPATAVLLMDRLRRRGYCFHRSGFGRPRPLEQILATQREAHCGGCSHNCFLSNPGCGVGRDKAARAAHRNSRN